MSLFVERLKRRTYIGLCKQHVDLTMMFYVVAFPLAGRGRARLFRQSAIKKKRLFRKNRRIINLR
ncbi:hypothetical protein A6K76_01275 [Caryophanon latum]|uniref:Uncharacterized protein n=1 Tax=Caryophanon latum TaxID=33977 RepID=A0A1C0YU92_9BACL|nr:hypothetical protein A6K76_01275 [Caryophanon latum]